MEAPVIGITVDSEPPGGYAGLPWYALRENYAEAVVRAGGLP
ncbi:MAG: gamma-glutamyl-gamma-aminobutyrate hydrolase family protein, partial [Rhodospirillales bacterium]|nr:gamma-glutamyl-gamma-aminobutyrate hydrolase family protein [Rhodospirillales bacterium]